MKNDLLLRVLRGEPVPRTPVWMMRQAGRYLPEYRATREAAGQFMTLCQTPDLACEVTLQPLARFRLDAAILFSDILTIPDAMGLGLSFVPGEGPAFARPVRSLADVQALPIPDMNDDLGYVMQAVRLIRRELDGSVPLIGFAGSPWTLATYMIEGQASRDFAAAKTLLYQEPRTLHLLLDKLALNTYWQRFLQNILAATNAHPLLAGNAARLLFDKQHLDADRCAELLAQNLSAANPSERAAYWLEGYLYQSGTVLLLHDPLWRILDDWLRALSAEHFTELLPLLRRTFSSFEPGERRQLGDKAREHAGDTPATTHPVAAAKPEHHADHGLAALQTVAAWLNLDVGAVSEA